MSRLLLSILPVVCLLSVLSGIGSAYGETLPDAAEDFSHIFFELLDRCEYRETYSFLSPELQKDTTESRWSIQMQTERELLGEVTSRRLVEIKKVETFADLPPSEYLVAIYDTSFSNQPKAREILVLLPDNGKYHLAAYKTDYNRWPEAARIIVNGLFLVFFIMSLLAVITWIMGQVAQRFNNTKEK